MNKTPKLHRQIFVLTLEEKKAVACILAALALGLATKHYRLTHPRPAPPPTAKEQYASTVAQRAAAAKSRSARRTKASSKPPTPRPDDNDED